MSASTLHTRYVDASPRVACLRCNEQIAHLQFRAPRSLPGRAAVAFQRSRKKNDKKNITNHSTCPRICFAPFLSRKPNRHSRLLTLALNREDAQDISAVVRVRRCPSRAVLHNFVVIVPLRRPCHAVLRCAVPGILPGFGAAPACFLDFFSEATTRMRTAARPAQGRPAITNLKHKTGGRKPHLPRLISACVWPTHPSSSLLRTHLGS